MIEQDGLWVVGLLFVMGLLRREAMAVAAFRDSGVGSGSSFVESFEGLGYVALVEGVLSTGGKMPRDL